jgi:proteasome assembly chaperone (PAC2) family protein
MDSSIRILSRIDPKDPVLLAAWPGMGNVAYGAAMYLREGLKAQKCAEILPQDIFYKTGVQIKDGIVEIPDLPKSEFFFHRNRGGGRDLLIFIGESQPVMEKEYELSRRVVEYAHSCRVKEIVTFAATPVNITHHVDPEVWGVTTESETLQRLPPLGVKIMGSGHIGGLNGLILGVGKEYGLKGLCLLGEIPFYTAKIENPKSSLSVLKVFSRYIDISIDLNSLVQMAKYVEDEIDRVSKATKDTLLSDEAQSEASEEKDREEEKKITESRTIPPEVRSRIEYMFEIASRDISKAGDLKRELDRWGIFQEYEDRFLDLFGRKNL